jgi:hypothetical protein
MGSRKKEVAALLAEAGDHDCRVKELKKGYMVFCTCGEHKTTIHKTPSGVNTTKRAAMTMRRWPCWTK